MTAAVIALGVLAVLLGIALGGAVAVAVAQRETLHRLRAEIAGLRAVEAAAEHAATEGARRLMRAVLSDDLDEPHPDPVPLDDVGVELSDAVLDAWDEIYHHATTEDGWANWPTDPTT